LAGGAWLSYLTFEFGDALLRVVLRHQMMVPLDSRECRLPAGGHRFGGY
jgi:hypothetical protein